MKVTNHTSSEEGLLEFHAYSYFSTEKQRKVNACHSVPIPVRAPKGQCMPLCANTCTCSERSRHATLCQYLYVLRKVNACHSVPIPVRAPKGQDMPLCANTCTCSDFVTALALLALLRGYHGFMVPVLAWRFPGKHWYGNQSQLANNSCKLNICNKEASRIYVIYAGL